MDETFSSEKQKAGDTNNVVESVMKLIAHVRTVDAFVGEEGRRGGGKEEMRRGQVTTIDWEIFA